MGTASSTGLSGKTDIVINLENQKALNFNTILDTLKISSGIDWSFGVGDNQVNCLFHDSDETDNTGKTVNLYSSGSLKNAFGDLITMEKLKLLYIKNTHATLTLEILGTAVSGLDIVSDPTDIIEIPPKGCFLFVAPLTGLDLTTNKDLKFKSKTAGDVTFDYAVMGLD